MIGRLEKLAEENRNIDTLYLNLSEMIDDMKKYLKAHQLCVIYENSLENNV